MSRIGRFHWVTLGMAALCAAGGGFVLGKIKERQFLESAGGKRDFMLLDDEGEFFRLAELPAGRLALLVFTPDGLPTDAVKPFFEFSRHVRELERRGVEVLLVSRTNREIVRNFKRAAGFTARYLVDAGGAVGRAAGFWPGPEPVGEWGYALVDRDFRVFWAANGEFPLSYDRIERELSALRPSLKTSSGSP